MRSIWLGNRLEFKFKGKILEGAITLGDIDNDGEGELVVGNMNGEIAVFKGVELWQSFPGLGTIAAIGVGDVMNCGSNVVVIVTAEGSCFVYLCLNNAGEKLQLVHKQTLPPNAKDMAIGDALGDGQTCMVLGFTDRMVRLYRWVQNPTDACLACLNVTECTSQIGSVSIGKNKRGNFVVYVAQPGPTYMTMEYNNQERASADNHIVNVVDKPNSANISSHLLSYVGKGGTTVMTLLDGNVICLEEDSNVKWSLELEQQTFRSAKVNVSPSGGDQVVTAAWSGHTYIIDPDGRAVLFELGCPILGFAAGPYGARGKSAVVYVTFDNKVIICYDIQVDTFILKSPQASLLADPELRSYTPEQLKKLTQYLLYDYPKNH